MLSNRYGQDIAFLRKHVDVIELTDSKNSRVAVVPSYQGRIITSTLAGNDGASFGWINKAFIKSGIKDPVFNNYGGEDRFWMGPEGGRFGFFFDKGSSFDLSQWREPKGFGRTPFDVVSRNDCSVKMAVQFELINYSGSNFQCEVERRILILDPGAVIGEVIPPHEVKAVAFESSNILINSGRTAWMRENGLPSIWILGQFKPLPHGKVIVPFNANKEMDISSKITTDYFLTPPSERCRIFDNHILFSCDGQFCSKIGVSADCARDVIGSYDPKTQTLTIVRFNLPADAAKRPYVNPRWDIGKHPFAGDAVNSYNDGQYKPGSGQLGPFYEIETSSPAAELKPGESITHSHRTCHFTGEFHALSHIARKILKVELSDIVKYL